MQLVAGATTITLPNDLQWIDEYTWQAVEQSTDRGLTGALIVDVGTRIAGRPITLQGQQDMGWVLRSTLDALRSLAQLPGQEMTLTNAEVTVFDVVFAHPDAIDAAPVYFVSPAVAARPYVVTLKFLTI